MTRQTETARDKPVVLLTGANGYVGGRLAGRIDLGRYRVRCLARRPEFLQQRVATGVEVAAGDAHHGRRSTCTATFPVPVEDRE